MTLFYIDRQTGKCCQEQIYYERWIRFFYGSNRLGRWIGYWIGRLPFCSKLAGYWQSRPASKTHIGPFITRYQINMNEVRQPLETFRSFNDFFIRTLRPESRPLDENPLVMPADGRYFIYPKLVDCVTYSVKGEMFSLEELLGSRALADSYAQGALIMARLCPTDYHRFHFPCDCIPSAPRLINGWLHSVNPIALRQNMRILTQNKRMITTLDSSLFGRILYCEIGATNVGSIHQTFTPNKPYSKGVEKGFFSFGGSMLLLLFQENRVEFAQDVVENSTQSIETLCLVGQFLGRRK